MKFPEVSQLGSIEVEGVGRFTVYLISDDWEPTLNGHDKEHGSGSCQCPCWPPLLVIEELVS